MNTKEKADIALKNRLYISGWGLSGQLKSARKYPDVYEVSLEYLDGKPVGVAVLGYGGHVSIFVRKDCRRKGIGTKLINSFGDKVKEVSWGICGSEDFFDAVNVEIGRG